MRNVSLLTYFLLMGVLTSHAQVSIAYYPFQSEVSISTHTERLLWGYLRVLTNTFWGNVTTEPALMLNLKRASRVNTYMGLGANLNFFNVASGLSVVNGYILYVGVRVKPIPNMPQVQIIGEVSPYMNPAFDGGLLRTRVGVAYLFDRKNRSTRNSQGKLNILLKR